MEEKGKKNKQTFYLMNFSMFSQYDIELFCTYKQFVQTTIIELGEDWRIQSGLLSQEIISILNNTMPAQAEPTSQRFQFNIFNEFLQPFLKQKIGYQKQVCSVSDTVIQDKFTEELNQHFLQNPKIIDSLTFKTLSLGFCIKAIDMWVKNFGNISDKDNPQFFLTPLGILHKGSEKKSQIKYTGDKSSIGDSTIRQNLSNIDLGSCHHSNSQMEEFKVKVVKEAVEKKWIPLKDLSEFKNEEIKGILHTLRKANYIKIQVVSNFAVNIHEMDTGQKKVRLISLSSQFYRIAFIVWLIFNIKLFFSITFDQYLIYFKYLMENWQASLEYPLKKFFLIIEKQWNLLLKDYSVALHDDLEVLKSLINRVRSSYEEIWKAKHQQISKKLSD